MEKQAETFALWSEEALTRIKAYYASRAAMEEDAVFAQEQPALFVQMHHRTNQSIMGFTTNRIGLQASEYLFVLRESVFDWAVYDRVCALVEAARRAYVLPDDTDQAFTFLSVAVLCKRIDSPAKKALARHQENKQAFYGGGQGWAMSRIAAVSQEGSFAGNRAGKDLCGLLRSILR